MPPIAPSQGFLFSVIIPVYNKEPFLRESLSSVLEQTIGFCENIQVILVDDGSSDGSSDICLEYQEKHPDNIEYYRQENKGVSAARNAGIDHAKGKYITFFDADDIWDKDAFEKALRLFEAHDEIDVVVAKLVQFGDITAAHPLDYKFKKTCVINLDINPDYIQPMIGNCFFTARSVLPRRFDTDLHFAEDTLFVNDILLDTMRVGILSETTYHYRKIKSSGTASMCSTIARYRSNNAVYRLLYERSLCKLGFIHSFVKNAALYELGWQVFARCEDDFDLSEKQMWANDINELLAPVSERDICSCRWLTATKRLCLLKMKNGDEFFDRVSWSDAGVGYHDGTRLFSLSNLSPVVINRMRFESGVVRLRGVTKLSYIDPTAQIELRGPNGSFPLSLAPFPSCDAVLVTGDTAFRAYSFSVEMPIKTAAGGVFSFVWVLKSGFQIKLPVQFTLYAGLTSRKSYYAQNGLIAKLIKPTELKFMKDRLSTHVASEVRMCRSVLKLSNFTIRRRLGIIGVRIASILYKAIKKRPVWIFVDREYKAGDNAEALFAFARKELKPSQVDLCFVLEKDSADFSRLKTLGTVLRPKTLRFYVKFLSAEKVLSGHHDAAVTNPFGKKGKYVADLFQYDFYNLSHGTLQGDLSAQLNTHVRPIYRFIVSAEMERAALLNDRYGYSEEEVALAGMCRYDMYDKRKTAKKIIFLPTWRVSLSGKIIPGSREREYIPDFEESEYCKRYNALINDEKLLSVMRQYGYTGEFYVHPNYEKQTACFHGNDVISVGGSSADYVRVLSEGALLVSDYSGVTFDFAYMRKPVVYYQFDDLFDGAHSYKGRYFSYEDDGFGKVCFGQASLVETIGAIIENGCEMDEVYRKRADDFFAYDDRDNCKRVLEVVMNS